MMHVKRFICNPYQECTYLLTDVEGGAYVVDPGMYTETEQTTFLNYLQTQAITLRHILITHTHADHICGLNLLREHFPDVSVIDADSGSREGLSLMPMKILKTPGHKEDAVCFYFESEKVLFSGDTLFRESIGRTDLEGGDWDKLVISVRQLLTLPPATLVYPGHGPSTTIAHERQANPIIRLSNTYI